MRCDDFLPWLESGGAQADAARRHAAQCASCRAAAAMLQRVKTDLSADKQMPAAMRDAMLGLADGEPAEIAKSERSAAPLPPVGPPRRHPLWLAAIAASLVGAAVGIWWQLRNGAEIVQPPNSIPGQSVRVAEGPADVRRVGPITVVTVDSRRDLAALADELAALEQTLADAKAGAERLAVSQTLDRVLLDFQRTVAMSGSR